MFHARRNADITQQLSIVTVPISIHDATDDAEIQKLEVAMFHVSEERGEDAIRMVQSVVTQSYKENFELGKRCYNMPATLVTVLMHPAEGVIILNPIDQMTLRSGVDKLMY